MAWIEVHESVREHPKTYSLSELLHIEQYAAGGLVIFLWTWALTNAQDGDLSRFTPTAIARACFWTKKPDLLVGALHNAGWLDDGMKIHDWEEYAGRLIEKRAKNTARMRNARAKPVQSTCDAQVEHNDNTCSACAGATVPNPTVPNPTQPNRTVRTYDDNVHVGDYGDEEAITYRLALSEIEQAAAGIGLPLESRDIQEVELLYADHGKEWILEAIRRMADKPKSKRSWGYMKGILNSWRAKGGIDDATMAGGGKETHTGGKADGSNDFSFLESTRL